MWFSFFEKKKTKTKNQCELVPLSTNAEPKQICKRVRFPFSEQNLDKPIWIYKNCTIIYFFAAMLPESAKSKSARLRYLKIQYIFYCANVVNSIVSMIPVVFLMKRLPQFLNSVWLPDPNLPANQTSGAWKPIVEEMLGTSYGLDAIAYLLAFHDMFGAFIAWKAGTPYDVAVTMITRTMANALDRMDKAVADGTANLSDIRTLYQSTRILTRDTDDVYGGLIFFYEILSLICHVTCTFAAMESTGTLMFPFFIHVAITFLVKMYLVYLPFVQVFHKSMKLKQRMMKIPDGSMLQHLGPANRKQVRQMTAGMRNIYFRPLGLHRMTHHSITDYVLAVFSNILMINSS